MFTKKELKQINSIPITEKYLDTPSGQKAIDKGLRDAKKLEDESLL